MKCIIFIQKLKTIIIIKKRKDIKTCLTSNVTVGPEDAGWRKVTEETVPVPDKMQTARGLCWANDTNFATISCHGKNYKSTSSWKMIQMHLCRSIFTRLQVNMCPTVYFRDAVSYSNIYVLNYF